MNNLATNNIESISKKIHYHFLQKYPESLDAVGVNYDTIYKIVSNCTMNSSTIPKIISTLDNKIKQNIYSQNRHTQPLQESIHKTDAQVNINIDKYLNNFSPIIDNKDIHKISNQKQNNALFNDLNKINNNEKILEGLKGVDAKINNIDYQDKIKEISADDDNPYSENFPLRNREKDVDMLVSEDREFNYYIIIDSKDRDYTKNPNPNNFVIEFSPSSGPDAPTSGYIDRGLGNIISMELLDVMVLNTSSLSDSSDAGDASYPYLLLNIDELGGNYLGTNTNLTKSFAILKDYSVTDSYKYYSMLGDASDMSTKKVFNPRINLTRLTVQILKPDGELFNFGSSSDSTSNTVVNLSMRVTTLQKNLATQFSNKATF
jgi:hypothetical protein